MKWKLGFIIPYEIEGKYKSTKNCKENFCFHLP